MGDAGSTKKTTARSDATLHRREIHEEWERDYLTPELDRFYDKAFVEIGRRLNAPKGAPLLDAGCGYCLHAVRLARLGFDVTGIDFSEAALEEGRAYLERLGMRDAVTLQQGNLLDLNFEAGQWPYVHCWGVLMHIPDLEGALSELARVTAKGGRLVIMENNMHSFHVARWIPFLRRIKGMMGRYNPTLSHTPRGVEMWFEKPGGEMLVRMLDHNFLERFLGSHGMVLEQRFAGQLTEIYTSLPLRPLKQAVYALSELWFDRVGKPGPAQGNIAIYRKA